MAGRRGSRHLAAGHVSGGDFSWISQDQNALGFSITFTLPFKRMDIWQELVADRMIGSESEDEIRYVVIKPGNDEENPISVGCVREATFGQPIHGRTVSELVELKAPSYIKWTTLLQKNTLFEFIGREDSVAPSVALALKENKRSKLNPEGGTTITIKYDFKEVVIHGLFCCLSCMAKSYIHARLQQSLPAKWKDSMIKRGYVPLKAASTAKNAQDIKRRMEEQARIKREARAKS
ncbi:hypothetical protein AB1Y20_008463 [Prymnesium parvum]|uniref:Uncharacterized protein n=1 Tax=Prymnesium parvum TaxID=97485 RepID=A0AB34ITY5_PRYPA|mmetsp:Transcript_20045/g.42711  ORF Transcript_20045/g.42711 Transcript_20045/m.42711 type:complete len:235 (-) Transcript_20045:195-899(-)